MRISDYHYLLVEPTHGSIDQKFKCRLVDGILGVGSGDTKDEAMESCIEQMFIEVTHIRNKFYELRPDLR